MQGLHNVAS